MPKEKSRGLTEGQKQITFLTLESPFPSIGGAHLRDAHVLKAFCKLGYTVDLICLNHDPRNQAEALQSPEILEECPANIQIQKIALEKKFSFSFFKSKPSPLEIPLSKNLAQAIRKSLKKSQLLWVSRLQLAKYLSLATEALLPSILDEPQIESSIHYQNWTESFSELRRLPQQFQNARWAYLAWRREKLACETSTVVAVTTEADSTKLKRLAPRAHIHLLPQSIDTTTYAPVRSQTGKNILFTGALNYGPNLEGLRWFIQNVYSRVRSRLGDSAPPLVVAGSNPSPEFAQELERSGVELFVQPPSLLPLFEQAAIVIVPNKSGRSMRMKVLEAMAAGRAVLTTPKGIEGLTLAPGYDVWIADQDDLYCSSLMRLIEEPNLRNSLGKHAAETVDRRFHFERFPLALQATIDYAHSCSRD